MIIFCGLKYQKATPADLPSCHFSKYDICLPTGYLSRRNWITSTSRPGANKHSHITCPYKKPASFPVGMPVWTSGTGANSSPQVSAPDILSNSDTIFLSEVK